jgi:transposase-like protein
MDVSLPRHRQHWVTPLISGSVNCDLPAAKRFLRKALQRHGRRDRIVIDGSQTNREAICACDAENRLQDRSRRSLPPIRIRQSGISTTGSSRTIGVLNDGCDL